jgi:hypothetical protein
VRLSGNWIGMTNAQWNRGTKSREFGRKIDMTPTTDKKCAHPPCSCTVASGEKYCGPQCEAMEDTPDIDCKCQHPNCKGHAI